jgi:hypothetical protein
VGALDIIDVSGLVETEEGTLEETVRGWRWIRKDGSVNKVEGQVYVWMWGLQLTSKAGCSVSELAGWSSYSLGNH